MDVAFHGDNTRIDHREAVEGIADQSCILCDTPDAESNKGCGWPDVKEVDRKITEQEVHEARQQEQSSRHQQFSEAVNGKDVEKAWQVLSRTVEGLTAPSDRDDEAQLARHVLGRTLWIAVRGATRFGHTCCLLEGQAPTPNAVSLGPCSRTRSSSSSWGEQKRADT